VDVDKSGVMDIVNGEEYPFKKTESEESIDYYTESEESIDYYTESEKSIDYYTESEENANEIKDFNEIYLESLEKGSMLKESKELDLSAQQLTPLEFLKLAQILKDSSSITHLKLSKCDINDTRANLLAGFLVNLKCSIESIDLSNNQIGNIGANSLLVLVRDTLRKSKKTIKINLTGNKVSKDLLQQIEESGKLSLKQDVDSLTFSSLLFAIKRQKPLKKTLKFLDIKPETLDGYLKHASEQNLLNEQDTFFVEKRWRKSTYSSSSAADSNIVKKL